jgi:hypothetical protein
MRSSPDLAVTISSASNPGLPSGSGSLFVY